MIASLSASQKTETRRYLAVWLPRLASDRLLRQHREASASQGDAPLVIVERHKGAMRLVALSRAASRAGLTIGLSLAEARARIPDLWVEEADPAADAALLDSLGEDCDRFSPIVMLDRPDGLTLDVTGCAHLFGGEPTLRRHVSERMRKAGLAARTVIAGAPDTARALARFGQIAILVPGQEAEAVRPLPIAAMALPEKDHIALSRAGLRTIGALADRPSLLFSSRFGEAMTERLHRLQGLAPTPLAPRRTPPLIWMEQSFPEPIGRIEDIEATLGALARSVCELLAHRLEGARRFEAGFHRADGAVRRIAVETSLAVRDPRLILRLFHERLDTLDDPLDPGFGFDLIRLSLPATQKLKSHQGGLDGHAQEADDLLDLTDRLSMRFGSHRVLRLVAEDTHHPARAARAIPACTTSVSDARWLAPLAGEPPLRPAQIFDPPQLIAATLVGLPDGPPRRFLWRRREYEIALAEGPERIAPEWWREPEDRARDYFRVEDKTGRRFWIFRLGAYGEAKTAWYLHGVFA